MDLIGLCVMGLRGWNRLLDKMGWLFACIYAWNFSDWIWIALYSLEPYDTLLLLIR